MICGAVMILVGFGVQIVTFMQHRGLGDDSIDDARARDCGWEDDCRFRAWPTMNLSLHQQHHWRAAVPCCRIRLAPDSPRLSTGHLLLMFVALVPPVWRRVMTPALR